MKSGVFPSLDLTGTLYDVLESLELVEEVEGISTTFIERLGGGDVVILLPTGLSDAAREHELRAVLPLALRVSDEDARVLH